MREHKPNPLLVNRRNKENPINSQVKGRSPFEKYTTLHVRQTLSENLPHNMQEKPMMKYISTYNDGFQPIKQASSKGISLATVKNAVIFKARQQQGQQQGYTLKIGQNNLAERKSNLTDRSRQYLDMRENRSPPAPLRHQKTVPTLSIDDYNCSQEITSKIEHPKNPKEKKFITDKTTSKFDQIRVKKSPQPSTFTSSSLLRSFQSLQAQINSISQSQLLQQLCSKQLLYSVDPCLLEKRHRKISWWSRAVLVDWMRHICYQYELQRETYHLAVALLDNFLQKTSGVARSQLQPIGVTTLFIASKLEEFQCRSSHEFAVSTNGCCTVEMIHELQIQIVMTLSFRINPPTIFSLASRLMQLWDWFIAESPQAKTNQIFQYKQRIFFKKVDQTSYRIFRELMQLIDCAVIDIQTSQYTPKTMVCSFMYLLIGLRLQIFNNDEIITNFPGSSLYLLDEDNPFNLLFRSYIQLCFGFSLLEILPSVQYCATFFNLEFTYENPLIDPQHLQQMGLEQYCSYQTFNNRMLKSIEKRFRGLY